MRIAVGGIEHESSNFSPLETRLEDFFVGTRWSESEELGRRKGDANTIVDGFLTGVRRGGGQVVPLIWCHAPSGGQPAQATHEELKRRLLAPLEAALPVDGVLLSLHGSYSAQGVDDADGDILVATRALVGPDTPIIAVHDLHSNIGEDMVRSATALIVEDTYPHTDMAERGIEAADMIVKTIRGEVRPTMGWTSLPLFWAAIKMISAEDPMRSLVEQLHAVERQPDVLTASVGVGYQWADVPCAGASTIVVTDGDAVNAQRRADELARWVWERRDVWQAAPMTALEGLAAGEAQGRYPIILADQADNPGGGAPSDNTEILQLFLDNQLEPSAVLHIVDPQAVEIAAAAGVGAVVDVDVGGRYELSGEPVRLHAEVLAVTDGLFTYDGPMFARLGGDHGKSVLLRQGGVHVAVISRTIQPIDLAFARTLGLDCTQTRYLCVKSTGHFRSGFGPIAGSIHNVDTESPFSQDFKRLPFRRLGRKIYPMDADTRFDLGGA